jgi:hypothetical protein
MESIRLSPNFRSMVERMAAEDPAAVVLGWWRRVEMALTYYTVAYHGKRTRTAALAEEQLSVDGRVSSGCIRGLRALRLVRNKVAHQCERVSSDAAILFATDALDLIWEMGDSVPDDLAISSGAARYV